MGQEDVVLPVGAASWALELPKSEVDRILDEGSLPPGVFVRFRNRRFVKRDGLAYVKFSAMERRRLSLKFRKEVLGKMAADRKYLWKDGLVTFDLAAVRSEVEDRVRLLRRAEDAVIEDPEVIAGEPSLRGTRMPVYMVAAMRETGTSVEEMVRSYPSLTAELIERACIYAAAYPKRGRPAEGVWRKYKPVERVSLAKRKSAEIRPRRR
jgi:uncharacterized protein (DUF433 family)